MNGRPILITGVTGFVGSTLAQLAARHWETYGMSSIACSPRGHGQYSPLRIDIRDKEGVRRTVSRIGPFSIIHCAALTDVDSCATKPALACDVNTRGTQNIALAAAEAEAKLVYVSTDLVFTGDRGHYTEEDVPRPLCVYGRTKYDGERIVESSCGNSCIARAALVFGFGLCPWPCFAEKLVHDLRAERNVRLFRDEFRNPIYLPSLCEALLEIAAGRMTGIYHLCGPERTSRLEFGLRLAEIFKFRKELIAATSLDQHPFLDARPRDCSMSNSKVVRELRTRILPVVEGLRDMHRQHLQACTAMESEDGRWVSNKAMDGDEV